MNTKKYILVEVEMTEGSELTMSELTTHFEDTVQADEQVGVVSCKAWAIEDPAFEGRRERVIHRDNQMLGRDKVDVVALFATVKV